MRRDLEIWIWPYAMVALLALAGCSARTSQTGTSQLTTYEQNASSILVTNCEACHGPNRAEGGYRIDTYLGAVARRDDGTPRVSYGDPDSALLKAAMGNGAGHSAIPADQLAVLNDWVVRSRVAKADYTIHDPGWMNPGDTSQFHGLVLRTGGSILPSGGYPVCEMRSFCNPQPLPGPSAGCGLLDMECLHPINGLATKARKVLCFAIWRRIVGGGPVRATSRDAGARADGRMSQYVSCAG